MRHVIGAICILWSFIFLVLELIYFGNSFWPRLMCSLTVSLLNIAGLILIFDFKFRVIRYFILRKKYASVKPVDEKDVLIRLRKVNALRSLKAFNTDLFDWSLPEWGNAVAGEVGEMCNIIKKIHRSDDLMDPKKQLADEMADIIIYLDLMAAREEIDLSTSIVQKFNEKSSKMNCNIKI